MHDAPLVEHLREGVGDEVRAVVGEDLIHAHVVGPEPVLGPPPEPHQGLGGLVVVGLDVGDARVVVDGDVQVRVAHRAPLGAIGALRLLRAAAMHAPAPAWGDLADLLDVEVHQLAGPPSARSGG